MARAKRILITAGVVIIVALGLCAGASALTLGVNVHPEEDLSAAEVYDVPDYSTVLNQMQAAGVQMVRLFVPWMWVQPNGPTDYDQSYLSALDAYVQAVKARGMRLDLDLVATPCWATSDTAVSCQDGAYGLSDAGANWAPADDSYYGDMAVFLAKRYSPAAIEVWNEPDTPDYFMPSDGESAAAQAYESLTAAAYTAIQNANLPTQVVAGALAQGDTAFLDQLYADGIASYSNAISIHPYNLDFDSAWESWGDPDTPIPGDAQGSFISAIPAIHQVMVDNGAATTPLWITEFGYSACDAAVLCLDEQTAADYLSESITELEGFSYVKVALVDEAWDSDGDLNSWNGFGLLRHDFTRRPSYCVLAEATHAQTDCTPDPLTGPAAAQNDLTRAWVLAREYAQANDDSFSGFGPAALTQADSSFSGYALSANDEAPSPAANPTQIGIEVTGGGSGITLCNAGPSQAYCVIETTSSSAATVTRGEASSGVWAAQSAVADGDSTSWAVPGPGSDLSLSASPATLAADGSSTTTLTATVSDAGGDPVTGDDISFSSSDSGQSIGPTIDHGDGTYTATLTSSTTAGEETIIATDTSADPGLSASVQLTQTSVSSGPAPVTTTTSTTATSPTVTSPINIPPSNQLPPGVGETRPLPRFSRASPGISVRTARLGARITLSLHNANDFSVALTRLDLWDGRVRLGRAVGCTRLAAGANCTVTITLSRTQVRRLAHLRRAVLDLVVAARAPAGDGATSVDRVRLAGSARRLVRSKRGR